MTAAAREQALVESRVRGRARGERGAGPRHGQGHPASNAPGAFGQTLPFGSRFPLVNLGRMGQKDPEGPSQRRQRTGRGRPRGPCGGREASEDWASEDWGGRSENLLNKVQKLFKGVERLDYRADARGFWSVGFSLTVPLGTADTPLGDRSIFEMVTKRLAKFPACRRCSINEAAMTTTELALTLL